MNENVKWVAAALLVVGGAVGAFVYFSERGQPAPVVAAPAAEAPAAVAAEPPAIRNLLPAADTPEPLPTLANSDTPVRQALSALVGAAAFERFVVPEELLRHFVVTVDTLTETRQAQRVRPLRPTPGLFAAGGGDEAPVLDPANYARYQPLVDLFSKTETATLVAIYTRYYPLLQGIYADLGHPPQYFNDRLVAVIDHLLTTPEVPQPIALTRPGVLYEYADPNVEALSAGQKLLLRMGPEHAAVIKRKLLELRAALATGVTG